MTTAYVATDPQTEETVVERPHVFLAVPAGADASLTVLTHQSIIYALGSGYKINHQCHASSLLEMNFNTCLCEARNAMSEGVNRFLLLHSDIAPQRQDYICRMCDLLDEYDLDALSVVSPIKSGDGMLTSSAIDTDPWHPRKLTLPELADCPETFTAGWAHDHWGHALLINTGCLLFRMTRNGEMAEWLKEFYWQMNQGIRQEDDGRWTALCEPEDWEMSRWMWENDVKYGQTRAIPLLHGHGSTWYTNQYKKPDVEEPTNDG